MTLWLSNHIAELALAFFAYLVAGVWWAATVSGDLKRAMKDIDGIAKIVGTRRSRGRRADD